MLSINRLLLLGVLSLLVYVQSAPVPDAAHARAIAVTERDVVAMRKPLTRRQLQSPLLLVQKKAKKHFTKGDAPQKLSVEIQEKAFQLTKSSSQGNNAVVYRDAAGDFAKSPLAKEATFTQEASVLNIQVGQLKAHGEDAYTGTEWMITAAAQGKVLNETPAFITAKAAGKEQCQTLAATAAGLAVAKAKSIFNAASTKGIVHGDLNAGNIFFDNDVAQVLTLIDWGSASKKASTWIGTKFGRLSDRKIDIESKWWGRKVEIGRECEFLVLERSLNSVSWCDPRSSSLLPPSAMHWRPPNPQYIVMSSSHFGDPRSLSPHVPGVSPKSFAAVKQHTAPRNNSNARGLRRNG
ncbi:hypothetical protein K438DRAFT_1777452 [Mycena galopus ATCC 62051]|nr:hypothetical protein K438DRAFT_1777452 [Mycena galopus ATCC 62051]